MLDCWVIDVGVETGPDGDLRRENDYRKALHELECLRRVDARTNCLVLARATARVELANEPTADVRLFDLVR